MVVQLGGRLSFTNQLAGAAIINGGIVAQKLDRHFTIQQRIMREPDLAHRPFAELAAEGIVFEKSLTRGSRLRHHFPKSTRRVVVQAAAINELILLYPQTPQSRNQIETNIYRILQSALRHQSWSLDLAYPPSRAPNRIAARKLPFTPKRTRRPGSEFLSCHVFRRQL